MAATEPNVWGVRGGKEGAAHDLFLKRGYIAIGWHEVGDVQDLTREEIKARLIQTNIYTGDSPEHPLGAIPGHASIIHRFIHDIRVGDVVVYPVLDDDAVFVGRVRGWYQYRPDIDAEFPHLYKAVWAGPYPRAAFPTGKGKLQRVTLFRLTEATDEFIGVVPHGTDARAARHFGEIPGIAPGTPFENRAALAEAGVHRPTVAGISGSEAEGADSIVLSGGYEDDEDYGDLLVYTGHGGNDQTTGKQVADQVMRHGNRALAKSADEGLPVRVARGARHRSPFSPSSGYSYDGLFYVDSYWRERGRSGHWIWRFKLVREAATSAGEVGAPIRRETTTQRIVRSTPVAQHVKALHQHRCQVCGIALVTSAGLYSEAAHIRPLGRPHNGTDTADNLLCLCPNHHVLFDRGGIVISEDYRVVDTQTGMTIEQLRTHPAHAIKRENFAYHRDLFPRGQ